MRFRLIRLFSALLLLCPVAAAGQDALNRLIASSRTGRLEFDYSFSSGLDTRMTGRGHALVQGECFFINGNGLEIYCDGKTAASIDRESKEVIIESIEGEDCGVSPGITKQDLMELGLSGGANSSLLRGRLLKKLEFPEHMSPNAMLQALNLLYNLEELTGIVSDLEKNDG